MPGAEETGRLTLPSGHVVLYDVEDAEVVLSRKWRTVPARHTTYAASGARSQYLHRVLMDARPGEVVHHVNGDGLDNRRANLRRTSQSANIGNKRVLKPNKAGYRGVYLRAKDGRYVAEIKVNYRKHHLGSYATAWEAAQAYNRAAVSAWGELATLNVEAA